MDLLTQPGLMECPCASLVGFGREQEGPTKRDRELEESMKRRYLPLLLVFFLLSACASPERAIEVPDEAAQTTTSTESLPVQTETVPPTDSPPASTEAATQTASPPAPVETPTATESQATPVSPFTAGSIGPGQQEAFTFQASSGEEIAFWLYVPENYEEDQTWPLILSLHGFLGFEPSLERVREQSPPAYLDPDVDFPFIVVSPRAPDGPWASYHAPMDELIEFLGESLSIDPNAQFLTGLSAGAIGVWQWALAFPDRFAGVALVAGGPTVNPNDPVPENICLLKDLPVWTAHSEVDQDVPIESSRAAIRALEECGSMVTRFTTYTDLSHAESFRTAFGGPELYDWMLTLAE